MLGGFNVAVHGSVKPLSLSTTACRMADTLHAVAIAMRDIDIAILCLSVRPSVRHVP